MRGFTRQQLTNLLGVLAIAVTLAGLAFGLPALDRSLPAERFVADDRPYAIGAGVSIVPPPGATVDVTGTRPRDDRGTALFRLGPVRYAISVQPFDGTLAAAATRLRERITGTPGYQVTGTQLAIATASGLAGLEGGYSAPGRGGRYAVFVADGRTIEVTVSGSELDLGLRLPMIDTSTRTLSYRAVS
ncbi:hypothetical protein [Krasilnikovia sp. MM14-A1259]|uniref:hypothetical protein n=1 Tax=Krasilnikovia sp. MM14-A1259 TaxID=3373539 RepID=UPI0038075F67